MLLIEPSTPAADAAADDLHQAIDRARAALLNKQSAIGHWVGELQGDSILESEYILIKFILGQEHEPCIPKIANYLRQLQQPDGGWNLYPGGAPDLSGTVKAYFALKLTGDDPNLPHMRAARKICLQLGGAEKCNSFTKFYFAALGQISYDAVPSIPPEIVFLPKWFYFNLFHLSAWTRVMILPLAVVNTFRPARRLHARLGIAELYVDRDAANRVGEPEAPTGLWPTTWRNFFLSIDGILKMYDEAPFAGLRKRAMRRCHEWLLEHIQDTEGLGAIFPSMVYLLRMYRALGYADDHPRVLRAQKELRDFFIEEEDTIRIQPCLSPVWDTGIALHALAETEIDPTDPGIEAATRWLLNMECREGSDWMKNCPNLDPADASGWFFEFANPHYPDTDDTAMAITSLNRLGGDRAKSAIARGKKWLLIMQNDDGGWAAFDRSKSRPLLEKIPFADHNAMQDPSCPDITGRVLEGLGHSGMTVADRPVLRGIAFIRSQQDESGGWWGRWGVNYVYGTWQVLCGLRAVGQDMNAPFLRAAADWLLSVQKPDGSFGETPLSYDDQSLKGTGPSTASQTAWGTMGMMAVLGPDNPAVKRGIDWLIKHQGADGNWEESFFTGTGFPRVFYLKYHLYRLYFPLMALARFRRLSTSR